MPTKKSDKFTDQQIIVLAAIFARSNTGQPLPEKEEVARLFAHGRLTLDSAVNSVCQPYIETDEHFDMFLDEAKMWAKTLRKDGIAKTTRIHKDIAALIPETAVA